MFSLLKKTDTNAQPRIPPQDIPAQNSSLFSVSQPGQLPDGPKPGVQPSAPTNLLHDLGPLPHSYAYFGVNNEQLPGGAHLNQMAEAPIVLGYLAFAIAKARLVPYEALSFTQLFGVDGFYAMAASRLGCSSSVCIDNDKEGHFSNAAVIARRLNIKQVNFIKAGVRADARFTATDVVANIGGLYYVDEPEKVLAMSYRLAKKYLIVQTIVSLAEDDESRHQAAAVGCEWGNRYSRKS